MASDVHVTRIGLPGYPREVYISIEADEGKDYVRVFSHFGDGLYLWMDEHQAEELGTAILAYAQTLRDRKRNPEYMRAE